MDFAGGGTLFGIVDVNKDGYGRLASDVAGKLALSAVSLSSNSGTAEGRSLAACFACAALPSSETVLDVKLLETETPPKLMCSETLVGSKVRT